MSALVGRSLAELTSHNFQERFQATATSSPAGVSSRTKRGLHVELADVTMQAQVSAAKSTSSTSAVEGSDDAAGRVRAKFNGVQVVAAGTSDVVVAGSEHHASRPALHASCSGGGASATLLGLDAAAPAMVCDDAPAVGRLEISLFTAGDIPSVTRTLPSSSTGYENLVATADFPVHVDGGDGFSAPFSLLIPCKDSSTQVPLAVVESVPTAADSNMLNSMSSILSTPSGLAGVADAAAAITADNKCVNSVREDSAAPLELADGDYTVVAAMMDMGGYMVESCVHFHQEEEHERISGLLSASTSASPAISYSPLLDGRRESVDSKPRHDQVGVLKAITNQAAS